MAVVYKMNHIFAGERLFIHYGYGYAYSCVAFFYCIKLSRSKTRTRINSNRILTALLPFLVAAEFFHSKIKCLKSKNSKSSSRQLF